MSFPLSGIPSRTLTAPRRVGSKTTAIPGSYTPECTSIVSSLTRVYARIGAPILSGPNSGNDCTCFPSIRADWANSRLAVQAP